MQEKFLSDLLAIHERSTAEAAEIVLEACGHNPVLASKEARDMLHYYKVNDLAKTYWTEIVFFIERGAGFLKF